MRIGVIGTGNVGSVLGELWVRAGHEVVLSSRHPERLKELALKLGERAIAGTPHQAALAGQVVLLAIPLKGIRELSREISAELRGKVVLNACNPIPEKDGEIALEAMRSGQGTAVWAAPLFPGSRMVRAFNSVPSDHLRKDAHKKKDPIGIPVASDDPGALEVACLLIHDAGFEPVVTGGLASAKMYEPGTAYWPKAIPAERLSELLSPRRAA